MFIFQFINYYATLFYIAFFKGRYVTLSIAVMKQYHVINYVILPQNASISGQQKGCVWLRPGTG